MKKAVTIPAVGDVGALVDFAVELEETGWDRVFLWDHMQVFPDQQLSWMDPWVLLGAIATATERVRLGTMVTPISRRRPWKLAKEAVTLDIRSWTGCCAVSRSSTTRSTLTSTRFRAVAASTDLDRSHAPYRRPIERAGDGMACPATS